jgi:hypothetical protein
MICILLIEEDRDYVELSSQMLVSSSVINTESEV